MRKCKASRIWWLHEWDLGCGGDYFSLIFLHYFLFNSTFFCSALFQWKVQTKRSVLGTARGGEGPQDTVGAGGTQRSQLCWWSGGGMSSCYGTVMDSHPPLETPGLRRQKINLIRNTCFHGSSSQGELFFISYCTLGNKKQTALTVPSRWQIFMCFPESLILLLQSPSCCGFMICFLPPSSSSVPPALLLELL